MENLTIPTLVMPDDPPEDMTVTETRVWEKHVDEYVKRDTYLSENVKTLYSLVMGQCTDALWARLEALDSYAVMSESANGISLLKAIKSIVYNFQDQKYLAHSIHDAKHRFYLLSQGKQTTQAYLEQFQNVVDVIEHCGGSLGFEPGLHEEILSKKGIPRQVVTTKQKDQIAKEAHERYLGTAFLCGSDQT